MIRGFVFDFDGLIADTESALVAAYADIHIRHGMPFDRELFLRSVGHAEYDFDPWHAFDKRADRAALETERQTRNRELNNQLPILPGVVGLLKDAQAAGLRLGMASNSSHTHVEGQMGRLGLARYIEFFACRGDTPSPKPAPDLYQLVLHRFGLSGPQAIAFEDSHTGVTAAKRAGLWAVAVPNVSTAHHDFSLADLKVASLAEVTVPELVTRFGASDSEK